MARRRSGKQAGEAGATPNGATVGHEAELWAMADALRGSMDAAEYKHVVLGLIFLKYISDAFEERHAAVLAEFGEDAAEDRDEYTAENIFWVPPEACWTHLKAQARQPTIGLTVDQAMAAIERGNPALRRFGGATPRSSSDQSHDGNAAHRSGPDGGIVSAVRQTFGGVCGGHHTLDCRCLFRGDTGEMPRPREHGTADGAGPATSGGSK